MDCCQCQGIEKVFDDKSVTKELARYRKSGPRPTTAKLLKALKAQGVRGLSLLDIGGGVGAIQHSLLDAGVEHATDVDASSANLQAARSEAQRRGFAEQVTFEHGNFLELAAQVPPADIVTLDRVICCFPDMPNMVRLSLERARKYYALVYPRDTWLVRLVIMLENLFLRISKNPFRSFAHPNEEVHAMITAAGFHRLYFDAGLFWQVAVYAK